MEDLKQLVADSVEWISSFGGTTDGGTTRRLYDDNWQNATNALKKRMQEYGLETSFDAIGNLTGQLKGKKYPDETILSGSHIDTVIDGGKLDGQFGIIAALLAVKYLKETYGTPLRNLEVIAMAEEEGSRFPFCFWGSKNFLGLAKKEDVENLIDDEGVPFVEAMHKAGFDFAQEPFTPRSDIQAFLELHIEQGGVLEKKQKTIGIVESIVGLRCYTVTLEGIANHAGTTPMDDRHDTIFAFSEICQHVINKAKAAGDPLVLTIGSVEVHPNSANVIPGKTTFTVDCRHTDNDFLENFAQELELDIKNIATKYGVAAHLERYFDVDATSMNQELMNKIETTCRKLTIPYQKMPSGAGHDSQIMATQFPTAMIFIPSINGISHSPKEDTHLDDLVNGVRTLAQTLYQLAYED